MSHLLNCTGHILRISDMVRSDGIYVYDDKGKQYMDLESGVWCTSLGHKNVQINNLIKKQIDAIMHTGFCYSNKILEEAAESVLSISKFKDGKCVFLCSGSESIELARQISKHITKKKLSMTLHDSYLGSYSAVTDRNENWFIFDWEKCISCPDKNSCKRNCKELQNIPEDISEFIFEPGSSSGFVRFPPQTLIRNIANIIKTQGGKIIVNEVTTGIGRTGKWFGHHHYDIVPDMIAAGKGIGNGYPVSATVINHQTVKALEEKSLAGQPFKYMQSHQDDPLGAAIVNEVISIINDNDLIPKAETKGKQFLKLLQSLIDNERILEVRGRGLMFAMDICDEATGNHLYEKLIQKGYIICNRKSLFRIDPPLTISETEFSTFIEDFKAILSTTN